MPVVYVTSGAWGAGTGTPNSAAQVDGNFYTFEQAIADLQAALAEGKMIESVEYGPDSFTLIFTDATTQVIPLPVAELTYRGAWQNSTPYSRTDLFSVPAVGFFQVLIAHTTPPAPAEFDPNATDGTTDNNPLYSLWFPLSDVNYDAALFVPGSIQRDEGELLFTGIANRSMKLNAGTLNCHAYLDIGNDGTGNTAIIISIQKNRSEIGTITFAVGTEIDTAGGQIGAFNIPAQVAFNEGDAYSLRITQSENVEPAGLSITLPFIRTDI